MSEPISTVVKVANSPDEAKLLIALLRGEGIPAFTDGQNTTDEFAISQRMLNMTAVNVRVPTAAADRAREILEQAPETKVDLDELTRQALEAADDPDAEHE